MQDPDDLSLESVDMLVNVTKPTVQPSALPNCDCSTNFPESHPHLSMPNNTNRTSHLTKSKDFLTSAPLWLLL